MSDTREQIAITYWKNIADAERGKIRQLLARISELVAENEKLRTELNALKDKHDSRQD